MSTIQQAWSRLSDAQLIAEVKRLAASERCATADLIRSLMLLDGRRLFLQEGCSSLFTYCVQVLRLSEHAAYGRISAARTARRFPIVLVLLQDGVITLTTVTLVAPHLTPENHRRVLDVVRHKRKQEVERIVAGLRPQPDVKPSVRKLPVRRPTRSASPAVPLLPTVEAADDMFDRLAPPIVSLPRAPVVRPLAPERYRVQLTVSRDTYDKLRRVQDLLRHSIPGGDEAEIFDRALTVLLERLEKNKYAAATRAGHPKSLRPRSRHIPAAVRREVWRRDAGRCAFVGTEGRCSETAWLEFHHSVPYAEGGGPAVENIELRCRAHNLHEAERWFGPLLVREAGARDSNSVWTEFVRCW